MSYRDAADALNARFGTAYSRSAALGRARRMDLAEPDGSRALPILTEARLHRLTERRKADDFRPLEFFRSRPEFERAEPV